MNIQTLRILSTGYLLFPNLLFFVYWTRSAVAVPGLAVLVYVFIVQLNDKEFVSFKTLTIQDTFYIGSLSLILTLISGIGGLCYQTGDYWCHNTKFYELYINDWPMRIPENGPVVSYYYGYYLTPVLLSRLLGAFNESCIFLWTYIGISLGISWIYLATNRKIFYLLICLFIGYTPRVIKEIASAFGVELYVYKDFVVDLWPAYENLFWAPNQAIPSLIVGGMVAYILKQKIAPEKGVFVTLLCFWWAFFPAFTSSLFVAILLLRKWIFAHFVVDWRLLIKQVILPSLACLPLLFLFISHREVPISGFIWAFGESKPNLLTEYLVNIGINLLLLVLGWRLTRGSDIKDSFPFYLAIFLLFSFSLFRIGKLNDFIARGPMPLLIILGIDLFDSLSAEKSYRALWQLARKSAYNFILLAFLFSSSIVALRRLARAIHINPLTASVFPDKVTFTPIPYNAYPNIYEVLKDKWSLREANQYLGDKHSFYERHISNKP